MHFCDELVLNQRSQYFYQGSIKYIFTNNQLSNGLYPLPDDKIFDLLKLKVFANDNINMAQKVQFFSHGVEKIVGKV